MAVVPLANRRTFLRGAAVLGTGLAVDTRGAVEAAEVTLGEDLMREHGVLKRVLLVYRDLIRRIDENQDVPAPVVKGSAELIRRFVEDYHEKLEEDYLFPRFRKAKRLVELVDVLYTQHQRGRVLTARILELGTPATVMSSSDRKRLREYLHLFVRMYEPHEAREDTVLFPAFHEIVSAREYDALGDEFEDKENQLFGGDGFEKNVAAVEDLEKRLGIYDLAQFTPKV